MAPWMLPVGLGILGAAGQAMTNRDQVRMSREQMRFQERMSSTAAQRSVADYAAAGLNPALAFDRPASSPGGASAQLGNVAGAGIATAVDARRVREEVEQMRQVTEKTRNERRLAEVNARIASNSEREVTHTAIAKARFERKAMQFQEALQPYQARVSAAEALLSEYMVPSAKNDAELSRRLGIFAPILKGVGSKIRPR